MQIEEIFEIEKENEKEVFEDLGNKMLLWYGKIQNKKIKEKDLLYVCRHGSRLTNFAGILSQGLRIAPPEAPVVSKILKFLGIYKWNMKYFRLVICLAKVYILLI